MTQEANTDSTEAFEALSEESAKNLTKQELWERKLLDLGLRNNLLNTRMGKTTLMLAETDVSALEDALFAGEEYEIVPAVDGKAGPRALRSLLEPAELKQALTRLYRAARTSLEENGANTLYLALGFLQWYETPKAEKPRMAPVVLLPIEIVRRSGASGYAIRGRDEETMLNYTLLEMLRQFYHIDIKGLDELPADEAGVDVKKMLQMMGDAVKGQPRWEVNEQCMAGIFSFNKFLMWNDIHRNADLLAHNPVVASLIEGRLRPEVLAGAQDYPDESLEDIIDEQNIVLPIPTDSSQAEAVVAAHSGQSFVLHGPPGSGKSQTITNIIANALYHGKRVLFVAEKMAALQVVQRRLGKIGLAPFCLELHSNKAKKSDILAQLQRTSEVARQAGNPDFALQARQIHAMRLKLGEYVQAMHRKYPSGLSLYDCIGKSEAHGALSAEGAEVAARALKEAQMQSVTHEDLLQAEALIGEYSAAVRICPPQRHPLLGIGLDEFAPATQQKAKEDLEGLLAAAEKAAGAQDAIARLKARYSDQLLAIDLASLRRQWQDACATNFLFRGSAQKKVLEQIQAFGTGGAKTAKEEVSSLLDTLALVQELNEARKRAGWLNLQDDEPQPPVMRTWLENLDQLRDWAIYNQQRNKLESIHLDYLARAVEEGYEGDVLALFRQTFYRAYAEFILASEASLAMFHRLSYEQQIAEFRKLSDRFMKLTQQEIVAKMSQSLPDFQAEAVQGSEVGILQRNIRSKGRGTSLRRLFEQIQDLLPRITPCMLMSPISVAQYIAAGKEPFDLVVFDEASQLPTSEAVGAIARGKQLIVVGDPKQMPPTNFFATDTYDEENADIEDLESILDDCLALTMPSRYLKWHYRSRHESLIAFSNHHYYEGRLLTYPSPDDKTKKVSYTHVEGLYERGTTRQNPAEAQAVVEEVRRRLQDPELCKSSIGIVTFNTNQQSLIEDKLGDLLDSSPELAERMQAWEDPIFVKNLENVQGDERDVILFSVGFGPDSEGKVTLNFGPLNRDGGWRRLNVAITRSCKEMMVFSTLRATDIDLGRTDAEGVRGLKEFLEYAQGNEVTGPVSASVPAPSDPFVEVLASRLEQEGHKVATHIGTSGYKLDIGIVHPSQPERYVLAVLCDSAVYASTPTERDREITQPDVLKGLGWNVMHIFALDALEDSVARISAALNGSPEPPQDKKPVPVPPAEKPAVAAPAPLPKPQEEEAISAAPVAPQAKKMLPATDAAATHLETPSSKQPYLVAELPANRLSASVLLANAHREEVQRMIAQVVEMEAPVCHGVLVQRLREALGLAGKIKKEREVEDYLCQCIFFQQLATTMASGEQVPPGSRITDGDERFYWRNENEPEGYTHYREAANRTPSQIAPREAANAIPRLLADQGTLLEEDLPKALANAFGFPRVTPSLRTLAQRALSIAQGRGEAMVQDGKIKDFKA